MERVNPARWREIERLYHETANRPSGERARFLEAACEDETLRRDVESLLQHRTGAQAFFDAPGPVLAGVLNPSENGSAVSGQLVGRALGVYQLNAFIGAGGMGEVYRAVDPRLNRTVAIKVLPAHVSQDADRRERFKREAKIISSLNHPHICALYDVGADEGIDYLVMEYVDGETLQQRLGHGPLSTDRALGYAIQICDALDKAHRRGVVHRDLKPANIMLTKAGVKLLDFGAAAWSVAAGGPASSRPAESAPSLTAEGTILGTLQYMAPEQLQGKTADARSDLFAFGVVVYEMLTGKSPFAGPSQASVISAVLRDDPPPVADLVPGLPPALGRAISRCLSKDPDDRWQTANDLLFELRSIESGAGTTRPASSPRGRSRWLERAAWVAGILAAAAAAFVWSERESPRLGAARVSVAIPPDVALFEIGRGSSVAVSPDGRRIAYVGITGGRRQLYMRRLDGFDNVALAGTEGGANPFFSPDGEWVGFTVGRPGGALKKVPALGGAVHAIADVGASGDIFSVQAADWGPDDTIFFAANHPKARGLWRVPASGGVARRVTTPREGELLHSWPQLVPGGKAVVYTIWANTGFEGGRIAVQALDGGPPTVLVERASYGRVVSSDASGAYLVYARPEGLHAAPFDIDRLQLAGRSMPVLDGVLTNLSGGAHFSISASGLLAYIPGQLDELHKTLLWVDRNGRASELGIIPGVGFQYRLSPDGRRLVRPNATGPRRDLWVDDLERRRPSTRLTAGRDINVPIWTPDGERVIYTSGVSKGNLFWRSADGTDDEERLTSGARQHIPGSVSPDGSLLAYTETHDARGSDIWLLPFAEPRTPRLLVGTPAGELYPEISPDGRWVAFSSNISGQFEIYLTSLRDGGRFPVSHGGGYRPLWSRDGRELYYRSVEPAQGGNMMVVSVAGKGARPQIGTPRILFPSPYQGEGAIAPDGRFLLLKPTRIESTSRVIQVVLNWFDELHAKVPR